MKNNTRFIKIAKNDKPRWDLIYATSALIIIFISNWYFNNKYIPVTEGFQYFGYLLQRGMLPYRDFFFWLPPVSLFISRFILFFGDAFIYERCYGIAERLILALALYYLLSRQFSSKASFVAVITGVFLYQTSLLDLHTNYYQTTYLFFILSLIAYQGATKSNHPWLNYAGAGCWAALAFFTKQSLGPVILIFFLFIIFWQGNWPQIARRLLAFLAGYSIPTSLIIAWLFKNQIFDQFILQVFGGTSAKGSLFSIIFDFLGRAYTLNTVLIFILIFLIIFLLIKVKLVKVWYTPCLNTNENGWLTIIFILLTLIFPLVIPQNLTFMAVTITAGMFINIFLVRLTFTILLIASITIGIVWILRKKQPFSIFISELILASFVWLYAHGMSYELSDHGPLLGIALLIAYTIDNIRINKPLFIQRLLTCLACLVVLIFTSQKMVFLYSWWGWTESGLYKNPTASIIPQLKGFRINHESVAIYDKIYQDILQNITPGENVFTYPHLTFFNFITKRLQPTFAAAHYFDICPDWIAIEDAARIKNNPPKMIVYLNIPPELYLFHEHVFRDGNTSGQRDMDAAIWEILGRYDYRAIDVFYSPEWNWTLSVWVKTDDSNQGTIY